MILDALKHSDSKLSLVVSGKRQDVALQAFARIISRNKHIGGGR